MNLLSRSTWKGVKLWFGEAKPDLKKCAYCHTVGCLVTSADVNDCRGQQVSSLGQITIL